MKVYIEVYGCSANVADFEIMSGLLKRAGFQIISSSTDSDLNIIVTCIVKKPTEARMLHKIKKFEKIGKPLVIAGCMPKAENELVKRISPKASLLGPNSIQKIVDVVNATLLGERTEFLIDLGEPKVCLPRERKNPIVNIVPIAEGCLWRKCTYCIVKHARGTLYSYPVDLIIKEIQQSLRDGCREIWLTGQDTGAYGQERGTNLVELLRKISAINNFFLVRIGMMNPTYTLRILLDLINIMRNEKMYKFLHLPVQSGDDDVLRVMNRSYSVEDFKRMIYSFRKEIPKVTIATDVICGFPSESKQAFENTMNLIKEIKPDVLNISKFYPRPNTLAKDMKQLPLREIKERSREMTNLFRRISSKKNRTWLGWKGEILIDEKGKYDSWVGRNFAYKPIIIKSNEFLLGKLLNVGVKKVFPSYLEAEVLDE